MYASSNTIQQHYGQSHQQHQQSQLPDSLEFSPLGFSPLPESLLMQKPSKQQPQHQHPPSNRKAAHQPTNLHHNNSSSSHYQRSSMSLSSSKANSVIKPSGQPDGNSIAMSQQQTSVGVVEFESASTVPIENDEILPDDTPVNSVFNSSWLFSAEHLRNGTPSRRDGISYEEEMKARRTGTSFITELARRLKLKPICKETATVYFHRFYMLRSLKVYQEKRIAMGCLYLASKFEDNPMFKDYFVGMYCSINGKGFRKTDQEFIDLCDRLIVDENLLLRVLGFNLQVKHFQVLIVTASQNPIEGTSKQFYANAYKVALDVNRLTTLCLQYSAPMLACVTLYLAACYTKVKLPKGWTFKLMADDSMAKRVGLEEMEKLICRVGEAHRSEIIQHSRTVQSIIQHHQQSAAAGPSSQGGSGHESTSSKLSKASPMYQHILTFSPDSAYSSSGGSVKSDTLSPPKLASLVGTSMQQQQQQQQHQQHRQPRLDMVAPIGNVDYMTENGYLGNDIHQQQLKRAYPETDMLMQLQQQQQSIVSKVINNKRIRLDPKQQMMLLQQQQQQHHQQIAYSHGTSAASIINALPPPPPGLPPQTSAAMFAAMNGGKL